MAAKRIAFDQEAREAVRRGVRQLARAVKVTLGPRGRAVLLEKKWGAPVVSVDGVTVAKEIELKDAYENMGAQMVKEVASKTNDVAGDGTTTSVVLAEAIFEEGLKNVTAGANPIALKRGIDKAVEAVVAELKRLSKPVRLDDLVREVAGHAKAVAEQAGVALTVGELPVATVDGDPDRLRQVFFNLFDNAVKYNRAGGTVTVRGHRAGRHVAIEVRDTGVGIPADELPRVFDRFYRVDKSRSRRMGGAGLGLSIVKALVEGHGGRVEVESTPGEGSTFRVVLPVHVPERREPHAQCTSG